MKIKKIIAMLIPFAMTMASCGETDYMTFDTNDSGVYFTKDTLEYSFGVTPVEVRSHTYKVPFRIMGPTSKDSRKVNFSIDASKTTAQEGVQYRIGEAVVMPDSINGYIPVEILRDGLAGTYAEGYTKYTIVLRLEKNEHFAPTLNEKSQVRQLTFDNSIEQPEWYNAHGDKVWNKATLGEWHPYKFIKMVEYYHAIETVLPETYKAMVEAYGENLEHIPYGDPYLYRTIFKKYIYQPMYAFFNDPNNRDMILAMYPDFPFDFPEP